MEFIGKLAVLFALAFASALGIALDCPRQLVQSDIDRYFSLLQKQDAFLQALSKLPEKCDADRPPDACPAGSVPADTVQVVPVASLTDVEQQELASLEDQIWLQEYFVHGHEPLTAEEYARKDVLDKSLKGNFELGTLAHRRQLELERARLNRRIWNGLARTKNDDLLRRILKNEPFPYGTNVLENGTVVLGNFKPRTTFDWYYWTSGTLCIPGFEPECAIGKSNQVARIK